LLPKGGGVPSAAFLVRCGYTPMEDRKASAKDWL
jgi:hypothetical protein